MKVIKSTEKYRVIETELATIDDDCAYVTIAPIFKVQMKFLFFWITIKSFENINEIELSCNEAIDCYNMLVNPYKYDG